MYRSPKCNSQTCVPVPKKFMNQILINVGHLFTMHALLKSNTVSEGFYLFSFILLAAPNKKDKIKEL